MFGVTLPTRGCQRLSFKLFYNALSKPLRLARVQLGVEALLSVRQLQQHVARLFAQVEAVVAQDGSTHALAGEGRF